MDQREPDEPNMCAAILIAALIVGLVYAILSALLP
jgi:flagellar biosynthesis protein FliQ